MSEISSLEKRIVRVESILIGLTIGAIASGDYIFGPQVSLGYLYLVPLSYSALSFRWRTTAVLVVVCVILRELFGPLEFSTWALVVRDWVLTGIFLSVVTLLHRLGRARHRFFETAREQRDELLREVELAAEVQRQLLSTHVPPTDSLDIVAKMEPAKVVGGDYYDFIQLEGRRQAVVIADVSGKGLPAALLMPAVQISLRALAVRYTGTEEILHHLNRVLHEAMGAATYATLLYAVIDPEERLIHHSNAGHQPGLHLSALTGEVAMLGTGGPPVGLLPGTRYETADSNFGPGDILLLYTDGIVETENEAEEDYGQERLKEVLLANRNCTSEDLVAAVHDSVRDFSGKTILDDDATVIAIKFPA